MNLTITEGAATFMRRMLQFSGGGEGAALRLSVQPGGCAGLSYDFAVAEAPEPGDVAVSAQGVTILIPEASRPFLEGLVVDFSDTVMSQGLTFTNPNATGSCGCGSSFTTDCAPSVPLQEGEGCSR